jgi:hypothetical protein
MPVYASTSIKEKNWRPCTAIAVDLEPGDRAADSVGGFLKQMGQQRLACRPGFSVRISARM